METIEITVNRVNLAKWSNPKSVWLIMQTDRCAAKGTMSWEPKIGERLKLAGDWRVYQGQKEFSFIQANPIVPQDRRALLHYICEIADGFGAAMEERIWDKYEDGWLDQKKMEVKGLTPTKWEEFTKALEYVYLHKLEAETVSWLMKMTLTQNMAQKAWNQWGEKTVSIVKNNIYKLTDLPMVGFAKVDELRKAFEIADDDPRRLEAGTFYAMSNLMAGGTTCAWRDLVLEMQCKIFRNVERDKIIKILGELLANGKLFGWRDTQMIATKNDYENEKLIWDYLCL